MVKAQLGKRESNGDSPYSAIFAAKQLVDKVGSVKAAQEALAVLAKP